MLLAIDIGNSTTKLGVFDNEKLITRLMIPTIRDKTAAEINESIKDEINRQSSGIIISSVVPELNDAFREFSAEYFNSTPVFVDNTFDFGFQIKYDPPEHAGA